MLHGECKKIDIGHLAWPVDVAGVDAAVFEKTDGAGPELVIFGAGRSAQPLNGLVQPEVVDGAAETSPPGPLSHRPPFPRERGPGGEVYGVGSASSPSRMTHLVPP